MEVIEQLIGHIIAMPHRPDHRFCIELEDRICNMFVKEGGPPTHVREIMQEPDLFDILHTLLHDMTLVMCHVVDALMLIWRL